MKVCSKCGKNFPDGVKQCPFDRTPLQTGEDQTPPPTAVKPAKTVPSSSHNAGPQPSSSFSDTDLQDMELSKDGPSRILVPSRIFVHSIFGIGIIIGAVMLFMVVASVTGLRSRSGSAAPSMETSTAVIMSVAGLFFLGTGLGLRKLFQHFSVIDLKRRKLLRMTRIMGKIIEEEAVIDLSNIKSLTVKSRTANVSADTIIDLILSLFKRKKATNNLMNSQDFSLIAVMKDGKETEISAFANGETASELAEKRKNFFSELLFS